MKHILNFIIISFTIILSSCVSEDNDSNFIIEDKGKYNSQIAAGANDNETWVETPFLIVGKLFGPEYLTEGNSRFSLEQTEITNDHIRITVIQEGLLDDSAYGEKRIIEFKYKDGKWKIDNIKLGFKCQSGRGHQNYSGELCS